MNNTLIDWMHDDISWCSDSRSCGMYNCIRNVVNMRDQTGVHSFSSFRGTGLCPLYRVEHMSDDQEETTII